MSNIKFLVIDLFCGAGGTTTGIEQAIDEQGNKIAKVTVCVNHDAVAIESHKMNHPDAVHFVEDVRKVNLVKLKSILDTDASKHPNAKIVLHASLECTHFSKAKGGDARDEDSRSLAYSLYQYIKILNPDFVTIENVREFRSWGEMEQRSKRTRNTVLYQIINGKKKEWIEKQYLSNEDFYKLNEYRPAMYPIKRKNGLYFRRWINEIKGFGYDYKDKDLNSADYGAYTSRVRYFGVFAKHQYCIAFPSATHSKAPEDSPLFGGALKPWKAVKEVLDLEDSGKSIIDRKKGLSEKTLERIYAGLEKFVGDGKSTEAFLSKYYTGNPMSKNISINGPAHTVTTSDHHSLIQPCWFVKFLSNNPRTGINRGVSVDIPAPTITCQGRIALAQCDFLSTYYKNGSNYSIDRPSPTLTTKDRVSKVNYLMNPQFNNKGSSIKKPCFTLIASMNKRPPYLITTEKGELAIQINTTDSKTMKKIKIFMALHGIYDIKMRMLKVSELKEITGFSKDYILKGNQADQKKFIGNAVVVVMGKVIIESLHKNNFKNNI